LIADPKRCRKETAPSHAQAALGLSPSRVGPDAESDTFGPTLIVLTDIALSGRWRATVSRRKYL